MTTLMDHVMLAQNTCLQMCVIGKNTFIGAGSTWTDYNLIPIDIRARDGHGGLGIANRAVLGGCVGHNCRIGSGMIVYPARTIESDVVLAASKERRIIDRDIKFEDSDHHKMRLDIAEKHKPMYHKQSEDEKESW
jgi:acetyltransferase-like isoleucine patch superfamily enzyme